MSQAGILQEQAIVILPSSAPGLILQVCYEGIAHGKQKVHGFTLCYVDSDYVLWSGFLVIQEVLDVSFAFD